MAMDTAYLSNKGRYIVFRWQNRKIRFMGPYDLQRFEKIKEWDKGYLVVEAKYKDSDEGVEDYIDLVPVLERLYIDPEKFLSPIKKVEVQYV
jgi:uncharacterized protein (UPF0305 family)